MICVTMVLQHLWSQETGLTKPDTCGVLIHGIVHIMVAKEFSRLQKK